MVRDSHQLRLDDPMPEKKRKPDDLTVTPGVDPYSAPSKGDVSPAGSATSNTLSVIEIIT